jgi:hypothetical protein
MAEYSNIPLQTVAENSNILFLDGDKACKKGYIQHRSGAGVFRLKGASNGCRAIYKVSFQANVAVATGGTVGPVSVALQEDGETLGNAIATVPGVIGEFNHISISTLIAVPCGCCVSISFENVSATAIDVTNANVIFERIA